MSKKIRMFEIMNECERLNLDIIKEWMDGIECKYLCVKHDKDLPRKPHYHIYVKMENGRTFKDISEQIGVAQQYIERVKKWKNAIAYAFHLTDGAKEDGKYEYKEDAVVFSRDININEIFKASKEYQEKRAHDKELDALLYKYGNCEITKRDMLKYLTPEDYDKKALKFKRMQEYRIMKVRDRNMNVIYITGESGSGKTTLAKYMAAIQKYDYFVSGSGKDVLDGYDKEECIILDDLRGDVFTKAELFKLTDNNTNSSVKSRFKNKDISYCKLMIITSIKTPRDLYNWTTYTQEDKDESFTQLSRRINHSFLYITQSGMIYNCRYDATDPLNTPNVKKEVLDFTMNEVFSALGIFKFLGNDITKSILNKIKEEIEENKKSIEKDLPF